MNVHIWWVAFGVCDLRGVELREIDSQSMRFIVIIDCKMTDNNITTGTYTITVVSSSETLLRKRLTNLLVSSQGDYSRDIPASSPSYGMHRCSYRQSVRRFQESGEP